MKILALIPARYDSTRFPGKPLASIHGKPMIQRVYEQCCKVFDNCYVATDDQRIYDKCIEIGAQVIMTSKQHKSGTDRCREALDKIKGDWDVVINIQGDEPFIATEQLKQIIELFNDPNTDIATLVKPFTEQENIENPNSPKVVLGVDGKALYFSRSVIPFLRGEQRELWQAKHNYLKHIGLYGYRASVLREITELGQSPLEIIESLEQLRWLENGYNIKTATTLLESHAIDTPEDLESLLKLFKASFCTE